MAPTGRRSPALPRAGSSHLCSPTSPSPSSTNTSSRRGSPRWGARALANSDGVRGWPTTASSATRTTSWCWWPEAAHAQALRLHLPVEEGSRGRDGEGAGADARVDEPVAHPSARPAQPATAGLDHLLPARGIEGDLQLPRQRRLASSGWLAPPQTPPCHLEVAPPPLPARMAADRGRCDALQPGQGNGQPLPLPG